MHILHQFSPLVNSLSAKVRSRIESGKINLEETEANLSDILHDIRTIISGQLHAKQPE